MPIYSYKNKNTGKVWDEYLSFDDRTKPLRNKSVEMVITAPRLYFIERREHGIRDQMIHSARESMRERQKEENAGFRDSPYWSRERTEKHLQKVR